MSTATANQLIGRLRLPKQSFDSLTFCAARPEELSAYLATLPHSNSAELCNRLYQLLPEVAGLKAPPGKKIALLDLVMPEAITCAQRLTHNLSLTSASTKILSLAIAMLRHLAEGYKSIIVGTVKSPAAPEELLSSACRSAIVVLHEILMDCWECYIPPPKNIWLEIHSIYGIASDRGAARSPSHAGGIRAGRENSAHSAYVTPLMVACMDPARHTPPEIRQINAFLCHCAHLVEFSEDMAEGVFVVDPSLDRGPQYSFKVSGDNPDSFKIKTYRLVRYIEEKLATDTLAGLNERLAKDLCRYWSSEIQRREDPDADSTPMTITFGLSHIHRSLSGTARLDSFLKEARGKGGKKSTVLELVEDNPGHARDTFLKKPTFAGGGENRRRSLERGGRPAAQPPSDDSNGLRQYAATRTNVSNGGARIEFHAPGETLTAGEVVLLKPRHRARFQVGLVRWTQVTRQLNRVLGVEILSDSAIPCALSQATAASKGDQQYYPGLIVRRDGGDQVIVPSLAFKPYSTVNLYLGAARKVVRLQALEDATYHVSVFELEGGA